jgi:hypothetical protein
LPPRKPSLFPTSKDRMTIRPDLARSGTSSNSPRKPVFPIKRLSICTLRECARRTKKKPSQTWRPPAIDQKAPDGVLKTSGHRPDHRWRDRHRFRLARPANRRKHSRYLWPPPPRCSR